VLHQVHQVAAPRALTGLAAPPSAALCRQLAAIEPVLASIAHAQTLVFIDERWAAEWQRLSKQLEALRRELGRSLR
jgi:hypothetical protein